MTNEHFDDLVKQALAELPPILSEKAADLLIVTKNDPPARAGRALCAFVQNPTHLRFEVYQSGFDNAAEQEVLEKLKTVIAEEFSFYYEC